MHEPALQRRRGELAFTPGPDSHVVHGPSARDGELSFSPMAMLGALCRRGATYKRVRVGVFLDASRLVIQSRIDEPARFVDHVRRAGELVQLLFVLAISIEFDEEAVGVSASFRSHHLGDGGAALHDMLRALVLPLGVQVRFHLLPMRTLPRLLVRPERVNRSL